MKKKIVFILLIPFIAYFAIFKPTDKSSKIEFQNRAVSSSVTNLKDDLFYGHIRPIFNNRCVVCHACYNSPCQLNLASYEGLDRGASKKDVYETERLTKTDPTRIFVDAKNTKDWRKKDFFPVVKHYTEEFISNYKPKTKTHVTKVNGRFVRKQIKEEVPTAEENLEKSTLYQMLKLKNENSHLKGFYESEDSRTCPDISKKKTVGSRRASPKVKHPGINEFIAYKKDLPFAGMPYGLPKLSDEEFKQIENWLLLGAPGPTDEIQKSITTPSKNIVFEVNKWEDFFNQKSIKAKITSRYLYEHLYLGHLYFKKSNKEFFRLVRSKTRTGKIDEIATVRPYDNPGRKFFYRLLKIHSTIVHKTHITLELSDKKMKRFEELFLESDWGEKETPLKLPRYSEDSHNPFKTFKRIPAKSRYQYLLDNAHYHIMNFIRGPVCKGNGALNVIDDQFWVMFVDPDKDLTINTPGFLKYAQRYLDLPGRTGSKYNLYSIKVRKNFRKYNNRKNDLYLKHLPEGVGTDWIWDGDGHNSNALLTVYRHTNSATVLKGFHGNIPKTLWVIDYPIFENIFYNLVTGYNVFGALPHHLNSRRYMEFNRVHSQDNFITLLPEKIRNSVRHSWSFDKDSKHPLDERKVSTFYKHYPEFLMSRDATKKMFYKFPYAFSDIKTKVDYASTSYKKELISKLVKNRFSKNVLQSMDSINCCENKSIKNKKIKNITTIKDFEFESKKVFGKIHGKLKGFPDLSYVRLKLGPNQYKVYTIIRNVAHYNVNYIFLEDYRKRPKHDKLNLLKEYVGSYPNLFFDFDLQESLEFLKDLNNLDNSEKLRIAFFEKYAISRFSQNFWKLSDWFYNDRISRFPIEGGQHDLNRYLNF